jgi:hypothetical protein
LWFGPCVGTVAGDTIGAVGKLFGTGTVARGVDGVVGLVTGGRVIGVTVTGG